MSAAWYLPAALAFGSLVWAEGSRTREAPSYSAASIVNAASNVAGPLAPYTVATIYGAGLAYSTRAVVASDLRDNALPLVLDGVRVLIAGIPAQLYYVSPTQVNFVVPPNLGPAEVTLTVTVDAAAGPRERLQMREAAPALFQHDAQTVIATRADWSLITANAPARPGEDIVLFATGLGRTAPPVRYPQLPKEAAQIEKWQQFQVWLAGVAVDGAHVSYVGLAPGYAGLYQVNLALPEKLEKDPEVRISVAGEMSPAGLHLPCAPGDAGPQRAPSSVRLIE